MLLDAFLDHIADTPLPLSLKEQVVQGTNISLDVLTKHPLMKCNVLYCNLWNYIFGTYPTRQDFSDFLSSTQMTFENAVVPSRAVATSMLQTWKVLALGLRIDLPKITQHIDQWISHCESEQFIIDTICKKWEHRFHTPYPKGKNLVDAFIHLLGSSRHLESEVAETYVEKRDAFTGHVVDFPRLRGDLLTTERIQYTLYQNTYFLLKLMSSVCVAVQDGMDEEDPFFLDSMNAIVKNSKKRVLVFSNGYASDLVKGVITYPLLPSVWYMLPRISSWFLLIGNDDKPCVHGIAAERAHNVYWSRMSSLIAPTHDMRYDRFLVEGDPVYTTETKHYKVGNTREFWKVHMTGSCPFQTMSPNNNSLLHMDFLNRYKVKHHDTIKALYTQDASFRQGCKNQIVILDNRENEMTVMSCVFALINTDSTWGCTVYTNNASVAYYQKKLPCFVTVKVLDMLEQPHFDIDVYNDALQDLSFWKGMQDQGVKKVLVIQDDGMLIAPGIHEFMRFDYVGAPWSDTPGNEYIKNVIDPNLVGNGGFSLRSVDWMVRVCQDYAKNKNELFFHNINRIPEDVYFVKYLKKHGAAIAPQDIATRFSSEQILGVPCLGFHKVWVYHTRETLVQFYDKFIA